MVCTPSKPLRNPPCIPRPIMNGLQGAGASASVVRTHPQEHPPGLEGRKEGQARERVSYKKSRALAPPSAVSPLRSPLAASPHPTHESLAGVSTRGHVYRALRTDVFHP